MGRWQVVFTTLNPKDFTRTWEVGVREAHIKSLRIHGHESALARLMLVQETLESPKALFEGWSRPDKEDSYVFVGVPANDRRSLTIKAPAPRDKLFLVFILPDGTIDHWNWRLRAPGSDTIPEDVKGKMIWPPTPRN